METCKSGSEGGCRKTVAYAIRRICLPYDESGDSGEGENGLKEVSIRRETESAEMEQESSSSSSVPEDPDGKVAATDESGNISSDDTVWQGS